ncbi:MAG: hypothetical protein HS132_19455 [Planctomycetia bacterium]|nr:hypothetical protein [Planctomycetia bacterium]
MKTSVYSLRTGVGENCNLKDDIVKQNLAPNILEIKKNWKNCWERH